MNHSPRYCLFLAACLLLLACGFIKTDIEHAPWQDLGCDSTQQVSDLSIYDLAQPFYESDTLLEQNIVPRAVFVAIAAPDGTIKATGVTPLPEQHPQLITTPVGVNSLNSTWIEQEFLGGLATAPRYLYTRWEQLLLNDRNDFLDKRDTIKSLMAQKHKSIRVISDLRSIANQRKYLKRKRTAAPVSMHNFGLAADFAIMRGRRISNNLASYRPLDTLTAQFGLTWGGNFVGFMDVGHIQYFKNGAELIRKYPVLRYEFEPYRPHYLSTMQKAVANGKLQKSEDTAELLTTMNELRKNQACPCHNPHVAIPKATIQRIQEKLQAASYQQSSDLLLVGDLASQTISLVSAKSTISYQLGKWR